ncbi:MAG: hypothetical protein ABIZ49_08185 [Opitutaceae bacterium]
MDDNAPKENPPADFNKLDLSQLQGFSFGTQWTQDKTSPSERRERSDQGADRPRRDAPGGPDRRDRRTFRRPAGTGPGAEGTPAPASPGGGERREFSGDRPPRREGAGEYRGGPRRDGPGGGGGAGQRYDRGPGGYAGRGAPQDRGPYDSPYFSVTFYPEDTSFNTLVQTIRKSCRTVELFEIARTVVAKTDRFVVVVAHKASGAGEAPRPTDAPPKAKPLFYISVPDGMPFESDESAVAHVLSNHLDKFFETAVVEVEPPKGNFQVINKCGMTGELLGPPNYHRYNQIVQQHHAAKLPRVGFEALKSRIETIRDPEVVNQWLEKMKKATRYTWKTPAAKPAAAPTAAAGSGGETAPSPHPDSNESAGVPEVSAETAAPATEPSAPVAAPAPTIPVFDTLEDARTFLLTQARDKVVRTVENARVHGKVAETMPQGEIRRAIEGSLERQRRFPLDTANALRGRLRREHFTIFKKGSKGVSYVCAVKRKFRVPGQTFSDSIGALISFIEAHPMIRASELQPKFLGLVVPPARPVEAQSGAAVPASEGGENVAAPEATPAAPPVETTPILSIEDRARLARLQGDLVWLVREGYVTEFIDGRLFAPPPMVEARKKEVEAEEHDPENFPEAPPAEATEATAPVEAPAIAPEAPAAGVAAADEVPVATEIPADSPAEETKPGS